MTTLFNFQPYFDDFDENKNFMRVLFRPGFSVQSRELTQLQTILTNQIEKFGNHIFQSGSPISGGRVSLDDKSNYIILKPQFNDLDLSSDDFIDKTIISFNSTKRTRAKVIAIDGSDPNNLILIVKYLSGDVFLENDELRVSGQNIFAQVRDFDAVGNSYVASIQEGVYYFRGQFVKVLPQFLVLEIFYKIGRNSTVVNVEPSYKIGIEFEETIVDEIDDNSLLDPAQGAFNYQAPGAHRFQIITRLSKRTLDSADESRFFEVLRIVDGIKTKEVEYPIYSEIEKTLARRTYDESGNYTVDPFVISLEEGDEANGKFDIFLDPGKAYVGGFEFQTIAPTKIEIDRARETADVDDFDLPTNYTSTVFLQNVGGTLAIPSFPLLDIHCVDSANVNVATVAIYNSTKVGSARAKMIKYSSSSNPEDGKTHVFSVSVFDVNSQAITGNVATGSTNNTIVLPATFSTNVTANAYANMFFRITSAAGASIPPILVTESDPSNKTIKLATNLPFAPSTANTFSLESDFKIAESFVRRDVSSKLFQGDISNLSKETKTGFAFIREPSRDSLVFGVPFEAVKDNSISDFDFFARKLYNNLLSDAAGTITVTSEGTDTFAFAGTPGTLSDSVILNNIICFITTDSASNSSTGITPNTILSLANSNFSVTAVSPTTFDINLGTPGVRVNLLITSRVNNAELGTTGAIRGKQLIPLLENLHEKVPFQFDDSEDVLPSANSNNISVSNVGRVYTDIGATYFENVTELKKLRTPGSVVSLQVPDVYEIVRITDSLSTSQNVTSQMLTNPAHDITSNFEFDNGQKRTHYDHATITLKRAFSSPKGRVYVQYKYLKHLSAPSPQNDGLFTVDSYLVPNSNFLYKDISIFVDKENDRAIPLRSAFDFRPTRAIGGTNLSGAVNPDPDVTASVDFEYFLSRIDQVVVKPSREFAVIRGKSAINAVAPPVTEEDMLIYTLSVPAFTESVREIRADFKNNRRFTMRDIGNFDRRIKGLEFYVSLNSLERNAVDNKILDNNGLERSKFGILVDNFGSPAIQASYADVGFDNRCLVENSELKPASLMRTFSLSLRRNLSTGPFKTVGTSDKKSLMLDYTTRQFAQQKYATKQFTVAAALFAGFTGSMKLYPEFVGDVDINSTAKVTLNSLQGVENAFTFINDAFKYIADQSGLWSDDKNSPFAKVPTSSWYTSSSTESFQVDQLLSFNENTNTTTRGNILTTVDNILLNQSFNLQQRQLSSSSSQIDVGTFVTDVAIQPYINPRPIIFTTSGLRPNTTFFHFFDNVDVNSYIVVPNRVTLNVSSGFSSGELSLIANNFTDLAANVSNFIAGGTNFDAVIVTTAEDGSNEYSIINETGKSLANKVIIGLDSGRTAVINSVIEHRSGIAVANTGNNSLKLASDAPSTNIAGNTIFLIHQTGDNIGIGKEYKIISYNTSTKEAKLDSSLAGYTGSFTYSFGPNRTNKFGEVSGSFYVPSSTFRSGERKFRVTESFNNTFDTDSISFAESSFVSSGLKLDKTTLVDTVYNVGILPKVVGSTTETRLVSQILRRDIVATWSFDPLAQTFFVDPLVYPYGLFIDNVDLFFKQKDDDNLPVRIQIRPTVNGAPHTDFWYPESDVTKYPSQIKISDDPDVLNVNTRTNFKFTTPVFLKPGLYALVILTDSPMYQVWVAEKGAITTRGENVSVNPYVGTLYKSQNSMEYVPIINEDIMFTMNRCVFRTGTASFVLETPVQSQTFNVDRFRVLSTTLKSLTDAPLSLDYSFISKTLSGLKEINFRAISPEIIYSMGTDSLYLVGNRRKIIKDRGDFSVKIDMSTRDDAITPVVSLENLYLNAWENFVDDAEISSDEFNIIEPGTGYSNSNTITVNSSTGSGAEILLNVDANGNVVSVNVVSSGSNYIDDFTIDIDSNTGTGAEIVLNSEFDSSGGPCDARYITKPITLADGFDSGDLRVFLAANKPGNSEIEVFYKILSQNDSTPFRERRYQKMECFNPTTTPSPTEFDYREYEYRPSLIDNKVSYTSEEGVTYDNFKTFAIKIVMLSNDRAVVPKVESLRIIALPGE